ncbi:unnamed protein product [Protopolystoma xenopodis]|uniref:Uncharacterized protein n=1 Tax=Protopolystoma xenopodis TaxID=117903 RepID=A0A3S5BLB7_9PLAT|nr:unnamed protein product [Protopolystoma xenopodis]
MELGTSPWTKKLPKLARPKMAYAAPECLAAVFASVPNSILTNVIGHRMHTHTPLNAHRRGSPPQQSQNHKHLEQSVAASCNPSVTSCQSDSDSMARPGPHSDVYSLGLLICAIYLYGRPAENSAEASGTSSSTESCLPGLGDGNRSKQTTAIQEV